MDNNRNPYPLEIIDLDPDTSEEVNKHRAWPSPFIFVGPNRYLIHKRFESEAAKIYNMEVRPTDTWVVSTIRSGTTLMQEMIWQLCNDFDFQNSRPLVEKFPHIEHCSLISPDFIEELVKERPESEASIRELHSSVVDRLANQPVTIPRFFKTHLALSLLPPDLLDTAKVVYITRNPLDVSVSLYHLLRLFRKFAYNGDFPSFWQKFVKGYVYSLPFFPHVKEAWGKRQHPNMLFLFYEEVIKDIPKTIRLVASFLGKEVTDDQVSMLVEHLRLENCKKNPSMNRDEVKDIGGMNPDKLGDFIRKGVSGGWVDYFDADMTRQAEQWIADNLRDTDLRFPVGFSAVMMPNEIIRKVDKNHHLGHIVLESMKSRPQDDTFLVDAYTDSRMSVGEMLHQSVRLAVSLRRLALRPGDVLALAGRNHTALPLPYYAAIMNGLPVAGVDPLYKYDEIKNLLKIIRPRIVFCDLGQYEVYGKVVEDLNLDVKIVTFKAGDCSLASLINGIEDSVDGFEPAPLDPDTTYVWLLSTSGSTGVPKMAACTHSVIMQRVDQVIRRAKLRNKDLADVKNGQRTIKYTMNTSPVQWMSCFLATLLPPLMNSAILQTSKGRDVGHFVDIINTYKPSSITLCPSLLSEMLNHERHCDVTCFDNVSLTGDKGFKDMLKEIRSRLRDDVKLQQVYALTESGAVLISRPEHPEDSVGIAVNDVQLKLVDPDTEIEITEPHKTGELLIKGHLMFTEYYNEPEKTARAFTEDGWFKTGDLLYRDENNVYYYVDRIQTIVKYRNTLVMPPEIEEVILAHPSVLEVAVTGVTHTVDLERPVACVIKRPGCEVTATEIKQLVADKLPTNKQLHGGVIFLDELPKTSTGKVARYKLKEIALHSRRE